MRWLPLLVYVLAAPTIAGSIMIALLTVNTDNRTLIIGTLAGFVIALQLHGSSLAVFGTPSVVHHRERQKSTLA